MNPTQEILSSRAEVTPVVWEEPYNDVIAANLDLLADTLPNVLQHIKAAEVHILTPTGRPQRHPAINFSYDANCRGLITSIDMLVADRREASSEERRLTVIRNEVLQFRERKLASFDGDHCIADITYPDNTPDIARIALVATAQRYNGPYKDRHQSRVE